MNDYEFIKQESDLEESVSNAEAEAKLDLLKYLSNSIRQSERGGVLEELIESTLIERLKDEDVRNEITSGTLLKGLIELKRLKVEEKGSILSLLSQKNYFLPPLPEKQKNESIVLPVKKEEPVTKEEFITAKKLLDMIESMKSE